MPPVLIRVAAADDDERLVALWAGERPDRPADAVRRWLVDERRRDPDLVLVAVRDDGGVVGTVTGAFDGERGWIRHLVVDPAARGGGVGRALVEELERRLRRLGAAQVSLNVFGANAGGRAFWRALGYEEVPEVVYARKRFG